MLLSSHTTLPLIKRCLRSAENLLIETRRDLKRTHQVHRKRIYESAQICNLPTIPLKNTSKILPLIKPSSCHTSQFKHKYVFWNSCVKRQTIIRWFNSVRIEVNRCSAIQFSKSSFGQYWTRSVSNNIGNFAISKANDFKNSQSPQSP